jgi:hypothetical protein
VLVGTFAPRGKGQMFRDVHLTPALMVNPPARWGGAAVWSVGAMGRGWLKRPAHCLRQRNRPLSGNPANGSCVRQRLPCAGGWMSSGRGGGQAVCSEGADPNWSFSDLANLIAMNISWEELCSSEPLFSIGHTGGRWEMGGAPITGAMDPVPLGLGSASGPRGGRPRCNMSTRGAKTVPRQPPGEEGSTRSRHLTQRPVARIRGGRPHSTGRVG